MLASIFTDGFWPRCLRGTRGSLPDTWIDFDQPDPAGYQDAIDDWNEWTENEVVQRLLDGEPIEWEG